MLCGVARRWVLSSSRVTLITQHLQRGFCKQHAIRFSSGSVCGEGGGVLAAFGDSNFQRIRQKNMFYVDKTQFAVNLLDYERAVLLRPPRSGKTLFVNTVDCLFDVRFEDQFDELFGGLHVGENKPQQANQFYVVKIPLTAVPVSAALVDYKNTFHDCVLDGVVEFLDSHHDILVSMGFHNAGEVYLQYRGNSFGALKHICNIVGADKLMVLVDEYDLAPMNLFASLAPKLDRHDVAAALEPVTDPLSGLLATLKSLGARFYITGIFTVPGLALSIFNDNKDLTHQANFSEAFGMTSDDVREGLHLVLRC